MARQSTQEETQLLQEEISKIKLELAKMEEEEKDLDREISALKQRELQAENETDEILAKEEALREEELKLAEKEKELNAKLIEAEEKEAVLKKHKDFEAEIELRLNGLLLSEDVHERKTWEELKFIGRQFSRQIKK